MATAAVRGSGAAASALHWIAPSLDSPELAYRELSPLARRVAIARAATTARGSAITPRAARGTPQPRSGTPGGGGAGRSASTVMTATSATRAWRAGPNERARSPVNTRSLTPQPALYLDPEGELERAHRALRANLAASTTTAAHAVAPSGRDRSPQPVGYPKELAEKMSLARVRSALHAHLDARALKAGSPTPSPTKWRGLGAAVAAGSYTGGLSARLAYASTARTEVVSSARSAGEMDPDTRRRTSEKLGAAASVRMAPGSLSSRQRPGSAIPPPGAERTPAFASLPSSSRFHAHDGASSSIRVAAPIGGGGTVSGNSREQARTTPSAAKVPPLALPFHEVVGDLPFASSNNAYTCTGDVSTSMSSDVLSEDDVEEQPQLALQPQRLVRPCDTCQGERHDRADEQAGVAPSPDDRSPASARPCSPEEATSAWPWPGDLEGPRGATLSTPPKLREDAPTPVKSASPPSMSHMFDFSLSSCNSGASVATDLEELSHSSSNGSFRLEEELRDRFDGKWLARASIDDVAPASAPAASAPSAPTSSMRAPVCSQTAASTGLGGESVAAAALSLGTALLSSHRFCHVSPNGAVATPSTVGAVELRARAAAAASAAAAAAAVAIAAAAAATTPPKAARSESFHAASHGGGEALRWRDEASSALAALGTTCGDASAQHAEEVDAGGCSGRAGRRWRPVGMAVAMALREVRRAQRASAAAGDAFW